MVIATEKVVSIEYNLSDDSGLVVDSSGTEAPLTYLHGAGNILTGFERALEGHAVGDEVSVTVPPKDGYGDYLDELVGDVERSSFDESSELEEGMLFEVEAPDGDTQVVAIRAVNADTVTVDGNHPLTGQNVHFRAKILDIRPATAEEVASGHPL